MSGLRLLSTGKCVPDRVVTNDDLSRIVDTNDDWIRKRTGMRERRYLSEGETLTALSAAAAKQAVEAAGIDPQEIGVVLTATLSADYFCPATSCLVQQRLGLRNDMLALDINAACSGFVFGLETMRGLLMATGSRAGLLIGAEALSAKLDMTDRGTCVLFGDGAAAAVAVLDETAPFTAVTGVSGDATMIACSVQDGLIRMDGRATYLFAVETVPLVMRQAAEKAGKDLDEIDHFILHQANYRILESVAQKLGQPLEKFVINIEKYGNTSGASVGLALHDANEAGRLKRGDTLMFCAFGAGKTYGAVVMEW